MLISRFITNTWWFVTCSFVFAQFLITTANSKATALWYVDMHLFVVSFAMKSYTNAHISIANSACQSVLMKHLGNSWMDFHEILYYGLLLKFADTFQFYLKSDKNGGHFTNIFALWCLYQENCLWCKFRNKWNTCTHFLMNTLFHNACCSLSKEAEISQRAIIISIQFLMLPDKLWSPGILTWIYKRWFINLSKPSDCNKYYQT